MSFSAVSMFSSINESEKVRWREGGGSDAVGVDVKKMLLIPFLGILAEQEKTDEVIMVLSLICLSVCVSLKLSQWMSVVEFV